jgi:hypothetical protein
MHASVRPRKFLLGGGAPLAEFLPRGSVQGWNLPRGKRRIESSKGMGLKLIAAWRESDVVGSVENDVVGSAFCELLPAQLHVLSFLVQKLAGVRMVEWRRQEQEKSGTWAQ